MQNLNTNKQTEIYPRKSDEALSRIHKNFKLNYDFSKYNNFIFVDYESMCFIESIRESDEYKKLMLHEYFQYAIDTHILYSGGTSSDFLRKYRLPCHLNKFINPGPYAILMRSDNKNEVNKIAQLNNQLPHEFVLEALVNYSRQNKLMFEIFYDECSDSFTYSD